VIVAGAQKRAVANRTENKTLRHKGKVIRM